MKVLKFENLKLHIIVWLVFIIYERVYSCVLRGTIDNLWNYLFFYAINLSLFYFNAHIVLPTALAQQKYRYFKLFLMAVAEIGIYTILRYLSLYLLIAAHIDPYPPFISNQFFASGCIYRAVYYLGLSTGYWFALSTYYNAKKIDDLEQIKLQDEIRTQTLEKTLLATENAYLKSQVNPHFLLHTLDFLRDSVLKFSGQVAGSFTTLSEIMRYALASAGEDGKVPLASELEHIANFIELNQARFSQRLRIDFSTDGDPTELRIIPLVLITMVENLFKYGDLLNESFPAKIIATIDENNLTFVTHNLKKKRIMERSHGIGIQNIKNRLNMYHNYELQIEEDDQVYKSTLKIQL